MVALQETGGWVILKHDGSLLLEQATGQGSSTRLDVVHVDAVASFDAGDIYVAVRVFEDSGHIMPGETIAVGAAQYKILNPFTVRNYTQSLAPEDWGLGDPD